MSFWEKCVDPDLELILPPYWRNTILNTPSSTFCIIRFDTQVGGNKNYSQLSILNYSQLLSTVPFVPFFWSSPSPRKVSSYPCANQDSAEDLVGSLCCSLEQFPSVYSCLLFLLLYILWHDPLWMPVSLVFLSYELRASSGLHSGSSLSRQQAELLMRLPPPRSFCQGSQSWATCCPMSTNHHFIYFVWFYICFRSGREISPCYTTMLESVIPDFSNLKEQNIHEIKKVD